MISAPTLADWVAAARDRKERELRQAVHTVLSGFYSESSGVGGSPVLKGGILLAIRYGSNRFTTDMDFSTTSRQVELAPELVVSQLVTAMALAEQRLPYGLVCRVQGHELRPPSESSTFPTLRIRVGYAPGNDMARMQRLRSGKAADIVSIDYSYNEVITGIELDNLGNHSPIRLSSITDLVAEKYRALLQQHERNRERYQDPWDLHWLLMRVPTLHEPTDRSEVLRALRLKCAGRIPVAGHSLANPELITRASRRYQTLATLVPAPLVPFEDVWGVVADYYVSLPW